MCDSSELEPEPPAHPADASRDAAARSEWDRIFADLAKRYPNAPRGVLFCIHKLEGQPELRLRDFKDEAALHGIPLSGRSFHSARLALGLEQPKPTVVETRAPVAAAAPAAAAAADDSPVIAALRRLQGESGHRADEMRSAIRDVLAIIDDALAD